MYLEVVEGIREILAVNLQRLMDERGLTQEKLADCMSSDQAYVSLVMRGKRWPRPATLDRLAKALDVAPEEFFKSQEQNTSNEFEKTEVTSSQGQALLLALHATIQACLAAGVLSDDDLEQARKLAEASEPQCKKA